MIRFPPKMEFVSDPKKGVNAVEMFGPLVNMFISYLSYINFVTYITNTYLLFIIRYCYSYL